MPDDHKQAALKLMRDAQENTRWRRQHCINLIPSEQPTSDFVLQLLTSLQVSTWIKFYLRNDFYQQLPNVFFNVGVGVVDAYKRIFRFFEG